MVYLDNAATSFPKPSPVVNAVTEAMTVYGGNPGRGGCPPSSLTGEQVYLCRETVNSFFDGYGPEYVVFTSNATSALNMAIFGTVLSSRRGQHLVITAWEHNSVYRPAEALKQAGGGYTVVSPSLSDDNETVRRIASALRRNTAAVVMTHASNVCGRILPVEKVGRLLAGTGIPLIVDASQSAGHRRLSMKDSHISLLCTAGHKGLLGPGGTGLLLLSPSHLPRPILFGGTGSNSSEPIPPALPPERYEAGTINVPGILGLGAGLSFLQDNTDLAARELFLTEHLYRGLSSLPGVRVLVPYEPDRCVPLLSFTVEKQDSFSLSDALGQRGFATRGGLHCAPLTHRYFGTFSRGTVRVSPGFSTTQEEMDEFLEVVESLL